MTPPIPRPPKRPRPRIICLTRLPTHRGHVCTPRAAPRQGQGPQDDLEQGRRAVHLAQHEDGRRHGAGAAQRRRRASDTRGDYTVRWAAQHARRARRAVAQCALSSARRAAAAAQGARGRHPQAEEELSAQLDAGQHGPRGGPPASRAVRRCPTPSQHALPLSILERAAWVRGFHHPSHRDSASFSSGGLRCAACRSAHLARLDPLLSCCSHLLGSWLAASPPAVRMLILRARDRRQVQGGAQGGDLGARDAHERGRVEARGQAAERPGGQV